MAVSTILLLLSLLVAPACPHQEAPVCLSDDASCQEALANEQVPAEHKAEEMAEQLLKSASSHTSDDQGNEPSCGLWLAESLVYPERLSLFTGISRKANELVAPPDLVLPLMDVNKNEWSPWHEFAWSSDLIHGLLLENTFLSDILVGGVGALVQCNDDGRANIASAGQPVHSGVNRSDATAGSFTYYHGFGYAAMHDLSAGTELFLECDRSDDEEFQLDDAPKAQSLAELAKYGLCLDALYVDTSTDPTLGRGAFTIHAVAAGDVVLTTPVLQLDRSQVDIVKQTKGDPYTLKTSREHGIQYTEETMRQQLLLNYCLGDPESNVLLWPYASGVLAINHAGHDDEHRLPNVKLVWGPDHEFADDDDDEISFREDYHNRIHFDVLDQAGEHRLLVSLVALRNIAPGEELWLDYGEEWAEAWKEHERTYNSTTDYVSADEYRRLHPNEVFRTLNEQETQPYPENLQTVCFFMDTENVAQRRFQREGKVIEWAQEEYFDCLRPCAIQSRYSVNENDKEVVYYDALVFNMGTVAQPEWCGEMPKDGLLVTKLPDYAVDIADKAYTSDVNMKNAFRHEIGVPKDFYPPAWKAADPRPMGDFIPKALKPGQLEVIRWADTGEPVTPNAYRLGLHPRIGETLLEYCNKMGITETFRHLTIGGNAMEPGTDAYVPLRGNTWYLQRPEPQWRSNLQWFSPGDEGSQQDYLQTLSIAGFDEVLSSIGEQLGFEGIVAYHVTFIGVSHSIQGYMHYDVTQTGAKTYNIIIPLILANQTGPELDLQDSSRKVDEDFDEDENVEWLVGRYRYEYNVASMMGDDAYHATSAVDYRTTKEFRMAATVYISDVNEDNVDNILNDYTQHYPPVDRDLLLSWAGLHWKKDDPSRKLPTPSTNHVLVEGSSSTATA